MADRIDEIKARVMRIMTMSPAGARGNFDIQYQHDHQIGDMIALAIKLLQDKITELESIYEEHSLHD